MRTTNKPIFFSWDSLTIYDGGSSTSPMIGKYCGNSIPPSHVSSSNEVLIHFQSDSVLPRAGFKMEYNLIGNNTSIQNNTEYNEDYYTELWEYSSFFLMIFFSYRVTQTFH